MLKYTIIMLADTIARIAPQASIEILDWVLRFSWSKRLLEKHICKSMPILSEYLLPVMDRTWASKEARWVAFQGYCYLEECRDRLRQAGIWPGDKSDFTTLRNPYFAMIFEVQCTMFRVEQTPAEWRSEIAECRKNCNSSVAELLVAFDTQKSMGIL